MLLKLLSFTFIAGGFFTLVSCSKTKPPINQSQTISDDSLLTLVQSKTFQYFWEGAEPVSGAARERFHVDGEYPDNDKNIVTSGGTGFGVMAILVGIERDFVTRQQGFERLTQIVHVCFSRRGTCIISTVKDVRHDQCSQHADDHQNHHEFDQREALLQSVSQMLSQRASPGLGDACHPKLSLECK